MATKDQIFHAVGKRKTAIARVYLKKGTGQILINEKTLKDYFDELNAFRVVRALKVLGQTQNFDATINVLGGGSAAQAEACMFGIAKALILVEASYRPDLKKEMLLTRDSRVVERKKYGHKKARKSFQFSKR
jgi:small subunit ribosomal protein S9